MLSVQGSTKLSWEEKAEKAFWRGRDSRRERLDLIDIARKHPDLINASITNFFFRDEIEKYGPGQSPISFFEFFEVTNTQWFLKSVIILDNFLIQDSIRK